MICLIESMIIPSGDVDDLLVIEYREFLQFMGNCTGAGSVEATTNKAPELISKLLWHSRQMDVKDSYSPVSPTVRPVSGMSDTYRHFNKQTYRPQPNRSLVDVTTFFDSECYKKPSTARKAVTTSKPGSLTVLFDFYARITSSKKKMNNNKLSFAQIQRGASTITFAEMILLLRDFDVLPRLLSKRELRQVWQSRLREEDNVFYRELTYNEFVDYLTRCALLAFPKLDHPGGKRYSSEFKINAFIQFLGIRSMSFVRKKLRTRGRETAGQLNFGVHSDTNEQLKYERNASRIARQAEASNIVSYDSAKITQLTRLFAPYKREMAETAWKCYKAPFIDMGTVLRSKLYRFKVELCNRSSYVLDIHSSLKECFWVRILSPNHPSLAPGLSLTIELEANFDKYRPKIEEKHATLLIEINSLRNREIAKEHIRIPLYCNLVNASSVAASNEGSGLRQHKEANLRPQTAPSSFSPGKRSMNRQIRQIRTNTTQRRRPHTAQSHSLVVEQKFR